MSTAREVDAYGRAADVGVRAVRRRQAQHLQPCHGRVVVWGPGPTRELAEPGPRCLPPRVRAIELTDEWLRLHHGLVATVDLPWVVLHAVEADVLYVVHQRDEARQSNHLRRVVR